MAEDIVVFWNVNEGIVAFWKHKWLKTLSSSKCKGVDDLDCLYKTKDYDSLWKVKADDIDSLHKTKDYDSLWKVKQQMTLIVFARQKTMIVFEK